VFLTLICRYLRAFSKGGWDDLCIEDMYIEDIHMAFICILFNRKLVRSYIKQPQDTILFSIKFARAYIKISNNTKPPHNTDKNVTMEEEKYHHDLMPKSTNNIPPARYRRHHQVTIMAKQEHSFKPPCKPRPHHPSCLLCRCVPETARHLLFECRHSKRTWVAAAS
jgi:hypothetical protein